jgi:hypothetical protein
MADITNTFLSGRMDKDLDERLIGEGVYRDALNIRVDVAEGENIGAASNALGNTIKSNLATLTGRTVVASKTIGAVKYERDNLIYWFVASNNFDGIFEYNAITQQVSRVLQCNRTSSSISILNFNQKYLITGVNYINGFLYWTDNYNEPRKINIARAKSYTINDARIRDDLRVIIAPPLNSPKISLSNDGTESNNLSDKFISFSYRYKYIDGQYSAMSPFSAVAFGPGAYGFNYSDGNNGSMKNTFNTADITVYSGGSNVTDIQLLFRDNRNLNIQVIETLNKKKLSINNYSSKSFKFKNNKTYTVLDVDQITRLFDNVPLLAKAQDFVGDRLMYGNYTQFFDIKGFERNDIKIDLGLDYISQSTTVNTPIQTFRSDRDYEVGIVYLDKYGRSSTVLTSDGNTVYIPPAQSVTGNSLKLKIKNEAPYWASNYRIVIKQGKNDYYNIFPLLFYSDSPYKYFLINESDRDKIKIGEYIIFKSTAAGPTLSNTKYKILELEAKAKGDFNSASVEGLYFKISTDSILDAGLNSITSLDFNGVGGGQTLRFNDSKRPKPWWNGGIVATSTRDMHYYGNGNKNALTFDVTYDSADNIDKRFRIVVISSTQYRCYYNADSNGGLYQDPIYISTNNISIGNYVIISTSYGKIRIKFQSQPIKGDIWTINKRKFIVPVMYNSAVVPTSNDNIQIKRGAVISISILEDRFNTNVNLGTQNFPPSNNNYDDIEEWWYESGACKQFKYIEYVNNKNIGAKNVMFRRGTYWGLAPGDNTDFDSNILTTPAGTGNFAPIRMIIQSSFTENSKGSNKNQPRFLIGLKINQTDNAVICETEVKKSDINLYHELSETYPIEDGKHLVGWRYSDFTSPSWAAGKTNLGQYTFGVAPTDRDIPHNFYAGQSIYVRSENNSYMPSGTYTILSIYDEFNIVIDFPFPGAGPVTGGYISYSIIDQNQLNYSTSPAIIKINNIGIENSDYNGWAFGNGLESNRILDDWNEATLEYSLRVNSTVDDYKNKISENAICYSGIYGINTGINRLNEFNLSLANFKYLDKAFGSIQKLHARDTDLLAFQEEKISSVLYGKNLLFDAAGGGQIASIPEVLGNQIAFQYENGISRNPESFAMWGEDIFCSDSRRGTVIQIRGNEIAEINGGMQSHFRDLMAENSNTQKLGGYDPYNKNYVLHYNDIPVLACNHSLSRNSFTTFGSAANGRPITIAPLFSINTESTWAISIVDNGYGTNWVTTSSAMSGTGNYNFDVQVAKNLTGSNRSIIFRVLFCGTEYEDFTLTQGTTQEKKITEIIYTNNTLTQWQRS